MSFPGYNLRGLIFDYLAEHGWAWSKENESWSLDDQGVEFRGPNASDLAIHEQIAIEEGKR